MKRWVDLSRRFWPLVAIAASATILAAAHAFQAAGYEPCDLCLKQREVYWGAIGVALIGMAAPRVWPNPLLPRTTAGFLGVAFLAGAAVAAYHAGVEWGFIPAPDTCKLVAGEVSRDLLAGLDRKRIIVPCDVAAWRDPVIKLSMAGWNVLLSLALAGASFWAAARPIETPAAVEKPIL